MRSFTFNGIESLVSPGWHVSDQINQRSTMQCTIVDVLNLTAIETGQEVIVYTEEKLGNARDIGDGTFTRTSNATMQDGTIVTANVTRYETGQFGQAIMIEEGTTNLMAAADSLQLTAVKSVTISAGAVYTVSISGESGSISLSGAGSGTVTSTAPVTITASTTTLTLTPTGNPTLCQVEQKSYKTSWIQGGIVRVVETLTLPTEGVFIRGNWTVEMVFIPTSTMNAGGYKDLWTNVITALVNAYYLAISPNGHLFIGIYSGGIYYAITSAIGFISLGGTYNITISGNGSIMRLYCNGIQIGSDTAYIEPVGTLPTNMYIGSDPGVAKANGLIDDLRISNIARSDEEILADYNSGVALPIDEHTTAKMAFDGTLEIFARPIIFGGTIDTLDDYEGDPGYLYYNIIAVDYNQLADKKLMAASYSSTLAGNIVSAIITAALSDEGITAGTIENGDTISKAVFNYIKATDALDYLKNVTGLNWNINFNKQLNFFSNASNISPWTLTDSVPHENFKRTRTRDQYRNKQYLRAGTGKTSVQTLEKPAPAPDGISRNFILRFPIAEKPVIYVNSTAVLSANVGVNGLDTGKEWYFTYNSNTVSEDSSEAELTAGSTLEVTYSGLYPIIAVIDDPAQISARQAVETGTSGIYESVVTEKSINENNQAIEYSEGLILKYGIIPSIVTFDTEVPGLQAGQLLPIQKSLYGINSSFLIDSVQISAADSGTTNYFVRCLDGSSLGGWEEWFKELLKGNREFVINENEVVILLNVQTENESWAGEITVITTTPLYPAEDLYPSETLYPGTATGLEVLND